LGDAFSRARTMDSNVDPAAMQQTALVGACLDRLAHLVTSWL
jgi:hypothetical protein